AGAAGSWTNITGNLGAQASKPRTVEVVRPAVGGQVYVLVGGLGGPLPVGGVFLTVNPGAATGGGTTRRPGPPGAPTHRGRGLHYDPIDDVLVAGTFGRGAWTLPAITTALPRRQTPGVFDPASATWYLRNQNSAGAPDAGKFQYGGHAWIPVVGDWDGDGKTT